MEATDHLAQLTGRNTGVRETHQSQCGDPCAWPRCARWRGSGSESALRARTAEFVRMRSQRPAEEIRMRRACCIQTEPRLPHLLRLADDEAVLHELPDVLACSVHKARQSIAMVVEAAQGGCNSARAAWLSVRVSREFAIEISEHSFCDKRQT